MPTRAAQYRVRPPTQAAPRPTAHQRGYDRRWQRYRLHYLATHPLCALCLEHNRTTQAEHVHHKDGKGPRGERGYDETNMQPLCASCHNRTTALGG